MADNESKFEKKKVDESWKERARLEREKVEQAAEAHKGEPIAKPADAPAPEELGEEMEEGYEQGELPPVNFLGFIAGIAAQASIYLGFVENPFTGKKEEDLEAAKHVIDTLAMLRDKTKGNLDETESMYLGDLLYGLQMEYVKRGKQ